MDDAATADLFFVFLILGLVVVVAVWLIIENNLSRRDSTRRDSTATAVLNEGLAPPLTRRGVGAGIDPETDPVRTGLRLGEISRHFDSNTSATIAGWLSHNLGFHGWGVGTGIGGLGLGVGRLGLGVGRLGLAGTSQVNLTLDGTTRDNLMSDGLVAVFEHDTAAGVDTVRLVVPSEQAARELVSSLLAEAAAGFTKTDRNGRIVVEYESAHATLRRLTPQLLTFPDEASYVSDRLHSVLRMSEESRPIITIWGTQLSQHAVLGSAIQIGTDGAIQPLFPVDLITRIRRVTEQAILASKGALPPQDTALGQLPSPGSKDGTDSEGPWRGPIDPWV